MHEMLTIFLPMFASKQTAVCRFFTNINFGPCEFVLRRCWTYVDDICWFVNKKPTNGETARLYGSARMSFICIWQKCLEFKQTSHRICRIAVRSYDYKPTYNQTFSTIYRNKPFNLHNLQFRLYHNLLHNSTISNITRKTEIYRYNFAFFREKGQQEN